MSRPVRFLALALLAATVAAGFAPARALGETQEDPNLRRGRIHFKAGKYPDAIQELRIALRRNNRNAEAHLWLGKALSRTQEYEKAVESLQQSVQIDPESEEAYVELGGAYLELDGRARAKGQNELAKEYLQKSEEAAKNLTQRKPQAKESFEFLIELALHKASAYREVNQLDKEQDQLDEALTHCEKVLSIDPNDVSTHLQRIRILVDQKRYKDAEKRCQEVLKINPKLHHPRLTLAKIRRQSGDNDGAIQILTEMLAEKKTQIEALLFRAEILLDQQKYEDALTDANEAIRLTNRNPLANFIRGCVYMQLKKLDAAVQEFQQAAAGMPRHLFAHFWLARCLLMKDRVRDAVEELNTVIKLDNRFVAARLILASAHLQQGYFDGAISTLVDAHAFDPRNVEVLRLLGIAYLQKNEFDRAAQMFKKMIELDPEAARAHQVLGGLALARGQIDEAIEHVHEALKVEPSNVDLHFLLGRAYLQRERYDGARRAFERVLELRGRHPGARMGLAEVHLKLGELDLAQEQLQHCIEEDPTLTPPRYRLTTLYIAERKYDKAEDELTKLLKVEQDKAKVHLAMAELHQARGEKEKAFQAARNALSLNPKLLPAHVFLARLHKADQNWPAALEEFDATLKEDVKFAPAYEAAVIQVYLARYDEAVKLFEKAINADLQRPAAYAGAGAALQLKGDYRGALANMSNADKEKPNDPLFALQTASVYLAQADAPNARTVIRQAKSLPDTTQQAYLGLVDDFTADPAKAKTVADALTRLIFYGSRGWYPQAEENCNLLLKVAPNNSFAYSVLSNVYRATNKPEKEIEILERLLDVAPKEPKHRLRLGALLMGVGRTKDARIQFEKAVEADPRVPESHFALGQYFLRMSQFDQAVEQAEKILTLRADDPDALAMLAQCHLNDKKIDKAREVLIRLAQKKDSPRSPLAQIQLAELAAAEGKIDQAIEQYKEAVENNPRSVEARLGYGQALCAKGRFKEAVTQFKDVLGIDSTDARALLALARIYRVTGRLDLAHETCEHAAQIAPSAREVRFELATIRLVQRQFDAAIAEFKTILKDEPNDLRAKIGIAEATFAAGNRAAALQQLIDIVREHPVPPALITLISFYKRLGEIEKAQAELETLVKATPEPMGMIDLGVLFIHKGRFDDAVQLIEQRFKTPYEIGPLLVRGTAFQLKGRLDDALEVFTEARKLSRDNVHFVTLLANALLANGQADKASEALGSLKTDPEIQAAYLALIDQVKGNPEKARLAANALNQAALYADTGWPTLARERYQKLLEALPGNLAILHLLADIHGRLDEPAKAAEAYELMLKTQADYEPALRALARYHLLGERPAKAAELFRQLRKARPRDIAIQLSLATCLQKEKKTDDAIEAYKQIIQQEPNNPIAYNNLAWIYAAEVNKLKEAEALATKAADLTTPDTAAGAAVRDTLGWIYYLTERYDKALELALQATEGMPGSAEVHYHLGMIYFKRNLRSSAARHLTATLQLDPNFTEKAKVTEVLDKIRQRTQ